MSYAGKLNFDLLLSHFVKSKSTANSDKVVSMLFPQPRWTYIDSTLIFNQIITLKQHLVIDIELTQLFQVCFNIVYHRWNNVDKHTLAQLSFPTKFQQWNNIASSTLILSMLFQRCFASIETTLINLRRFNFHFQSNINVDGFTGIFPENFIKIPLVVQNIFIFLDLIHQYQLFSSIFWFFWHLIVTENTNDVVI